MSLALRIKERRLALEMSQQQLADAVLVTPGAISHYESDQRDPSIEVLVRLAAALRCQVGDLFDALAAPPMVLCPTCHGTGCVPSTVANRICRDRTTQILHQIQSDLLQSEVTAVAG